MPISISTKLDKHKLVALMNGAGPKAQMVLDKTARDIEAGWKEEIVSKHVIDTGTYLNSVRVRDDHGPFDRTISDGVTYGVFQEFGHHGGAVAARPCAGPAVDRVRKVFAEAWRQLFK